MTRDEEMTVMAHMYANGMTPMCPDRNKLKMTYYANYIAGWKAADATRVNK